MQDGEQFPQVIDIVDGEYVLRYMQKSKDGFKWPAKDDISQEPPDHIVQRLSNPNAIEKTNKMLFQFKIDY